ncbi:MAG: hypothetical protein JSC161_000740 [Candidatus Tokpelaia sp. JSC161]|nr:MAG: hypothetical protein JSC161_000740 [Candidatus Tokpelaia sp. JSC161]
MTQENIASLTAFFQLGLSKKVLQAVKDAGYERPTLIQVSAIPHILQHRDVLGIAQTGTGKTASFVLPMLTLLEKGRTRARIPRTLILEPTRELAAQVEENFIKYGRNHRFKVVLLIGGIPFEKQERQLKRGADVLIATPGRLLDHFDRGTLLLTGVEILVLDEADRMLDMGFIPDVERVCKLIPLKRQTLFFSATMPPGITHLTEKFLHIPKKIEIAKTSSIVHTITQRLVQSNATAREKRELLRKLIKKENKELKNAIIFCNRKRDVSALVHSLKRHNFNPGTLHGDMNHSARMSILTNFKNGKLKLLVASDIAARGLDIPNVSHVFNFDVPTHSEEYVHRIGRTGRAGRYGKAFTIVTKNDMKYIQAIEKMSGENIEWLNEDMEDMTVTENTGEVSKRNIKSEDQQSISKTQFGFGENIPAFMLLSTRAN